MAKGESYLKNARVERNADADLMLHIHSGDLKAMFNLSAMAGEMSAVGEENVMLRTLEAWYADQDKSNGY